MAAPSTITRVTPTGIYLQRGGPGVKIAFNGCPNLSIWEVTVQPPGITSGDPINITTQWNTVWITKVEQILKELTDGQVTFAYDPGVFGTTQAQSIINDNDSCTMRFYEGSTLDFWGLMNDISFDPNSREEMPMGTGTIVCTNFDPVNRAEAAPVMTSVAGS